ncbi:MAG: carbohydrate kinase family protein [Ktedonobacterales bacterium]
MMIDVVTLGEILIDLVATQQNVPLFAAPAFEPKAGGAPANVAVGVRRLGKTAAFIGKVGRDEFGQGLRETLAEGGVETHSLLDDARLPTTLAFVSLSEGGETHFAFYPGAHTNLTLDDLDLDLIRSAHIFHCGSVSLAHQPVRGATLAALRTAHDAGVICSYDVNWRPALWADAAAGLALARQPLALADIVKMNAGELRLLTGDADVERALLGLRAPAALVVVTLGGEGCIYRFGGALYRQTSAPVGEAVDATGAGDAFVAALLATLSRHPRDLDAAALDPMTRRACRAGAITVTRRGAIPALPFARELEEV